MELLEWIHNIDAQILLFIQQYLRRRLVLDCFGAALSFSKEDMKGRCNRTSGTSYRGSGYEFMP